MVQVLEAVEIEGDAGQMDSRLEGEDASYCYLLTMPEAKSDLNDALAHSRFAGKIYFTQLGFVLTAASSWDGCSHSLRRCRLHRIQTRLH